MAKSKNDEVNFHIEITVTKGEHAHVFKLTVATSTSPLQAKDLSGCAGTLSIQDGGDGQGCTDCITAPSATICGVT